MPLQYGANSGKKSLKNILTSPMQFSSIITGDLTAGNINASDINLPFLQGGILSNIGIENCTIDSSSIGSQTPSDAYFNLLTTGSNTAGGYPVTFWGSDAAHYVLWDPNTNQLIINGSVFVSDFVQSGANIIIVDNDIKAINTDGNVNIIPNGNGVITLQGGVSQTSETGPVSFDTYGPITMNSNDGPITLYGMEDMNLETDDGDIILQTDKYISPYDIISITYQLGIGCKVVTSIDHRFLLNDTVTIQGSDSIPSIDGTYHVIGIPNKRTLYLDAPIITTPGTTGIIQRVPTHRIIFLPGSKMILSEEKPFYFGTNSYMYGSDSDGFYYNTPNNITFDLLSGKYLSFPTSDSGITFNNTNNRITGDTSNLYINSNGSIITQTGNIKFLSDPVITVGNNILQDSQDRGIEIYYNNTNISKIGFMGYDSSLNRYRFLINATNNNEVFSGDDADLQAAHIYGSDLTINNITGPVNNNLDLFGDPDLFLRATRYIYLNAGSAIKIPDSIPINLGTSGSISNLNGDITVQSGDTIYLSPTTDIRIPLSKEIYLDGNTLNKSISGETLGLYINSDYNTYLNTIAGSVFMNQNVPLVLGLSSQNIVGSGTELNINSGANINLIPVNNVTIPLNKKLILGNTSDYIYGNDGIFVNSNNAFTLNSRNNISMTSSSGDILLSSPGKISLNSNSYVLIPENIPLEFKDDTNYIKNNDLTDSFIINSDSNNINIQSSSKNIYLSPHDSINIPLGTYIYMGSDNKKFLQSSGTEIFLTNQNGDITLTGTNTNINGNLNVTGTLTYLNVQNVSTTDPVITLGINTIDDNKDRGIEYKWNTLGTQKIGFFGIKDSTGRFTYIPDAVNNGEVFTGTPGDFDIGDLYTTGIDLQGGSIINANNLSLSNLNGNPDLTLTGRYIYLTASNSVVIPSGIPITYGSCSISGDSTNLSFNSPGNFIFTGSSTGTYTINTETINLNATDSINIPQNIPVYFDTNNYISGNNTTGLTLNSSNTNITGNLNIGTQSSISESVSGLTINSGTGPILFDSDLIKLQTNSILNFGSTGENIYSDGTNLILSSDTGLVKIQNNLDVTGSITNATWNGDLIDLLHGGTNNTTWTQGSVVFVGLNKLTENNSKFFWDDTNYRLSIGANNISYHNLNIKGDHLCFIPTLESNSQGILYRNTVNKYNIWVYRKSVTGNNADYIIATGNETLYTNLVPRFIISGSNGYVGIGYSSSTSITEPLSVNGNQFLNGSLKFSPTEYINIDGSNNLRIYSNNQIQLKPVNGVNIPSDIKLEFGTSGSNNNYILYNSLQDKLNITSSNILNLNATNYVTIPQNTKLTFGNNNNYIYNPTGSTDLYIDSGTNIVIPDTTKLYFDNIQYIYGDTSNLYLSSTGNINLQAAISVIIPNNIPLYLGTNQLYQDTNNAFIMNSLGDINFEIGSNYNINIPDNVRLTFGDYSRGLESDGSILHIYGADTQVEGNLTVLGDLNVQGTTISTNTQQITAEGHILILGNGNKLPITNITNGDLTDTVFVTTDTTYHRLVDGDTVTISETNSSPVIDGDYTITVIDNYTYRISFTGGIISDGDLGFSTSIKVYNNSKDIGIQANWHNGNIGTIGAKYAFFGYKTSLGRWVFIKDGINNNEIFTGTLGDIECAKVYCSNISGFTLDGNLIGGSNQISGSNFDINGGTIDNVTINNSSGTFTSLNSNNATLTGGTINNMIIGNSIPTSANFTSITVTDDTLVNNLNSEYLNGYTYDSFVLRNGTLALTDNWDSGIYDIKSNTFTEDSLTPYGIVFADNNKTLVNNSHMIYDVVNDTLYIDSCSITSVDISSGNISNTNITLYPGNTLDVSDGTVIFADNQISGDKISGGTADCDISGNSNTVTNGLYTTDYNSDNCILKADVSNTPIVLNVPENTILGRKTGGVITALTTTEVANMIGTGGGGGPLDELSIHNAGGLTSNYENNLNNVLNYSYEEISVSGGDSNVLNYSKNISFITVTGTGVATINMETVIKTGQWKTIICVSIPDNCELDLIFPIGTLQLINMSIDSIKTIRYPKSGMGIQLIWNNTVQKWFILPTSGVVV